MEKLSAAINAEEARAPRPAASAHQLHATALVRRRIEKPHHRHRSLLPTRRKRPSRGAAEQRDELAALCMTRKKHCES
jgi:hypothetical protein